MSMKKFFALSVISLLTTSAFAATVEVEFPLAQKNGSFNCTASDSSAIVQIDTHGLEAQGFCAGSKYVTRDGHISGLSAKDLNDYYFTIDKPQEKTASVSVTVSSGDIKCATGRGSKTKAFGEGTKFCMIKS
jgi:hypothetical protein